MTDLTDIEEEHGFVFGVPDDTVLTKAAPVLRQVTCENLGCERARGGQHETPIPIHEDTILPVFCGGCGQVVHCNHRADAAEELVVGSFANPQLMRTTRCLDCRSVIDTETVALKPPNVEDLDAGALHQAGVATFTRDDGE